MKKIALSLSQSYWPPVCFVLTNKQMGTVGGAALGGAVGYRVTAAAYAVGAVGGGLMCRITLIPETNRISPGYCRAYFFLAPFSADISTY